MTEPNQDRITYAHILRVLDSTDDTDKMCLEAINCLKTIREDLKQVVKVKEKIQLIEKMYENPYSDNYRKQQLKIIHIITDLYEHLELDEETFSLPTD